MDLYVKRVPKFYAVFFNGRNVKEVMDFLFGLNIHYTYLSSGSRFLISNKKKEDSTYLILEANYTLVVDEDGIHNVYTLDQFHKNFEKKVVRE